MPVEMAIERIKNGDPYIIRFKSPGNPDKKIKHITWCLQIGGEKETHIYSHRFKIFLCIC